MRTMSTVLGGLAELEIRSDNANNNNTVCMYDLCCMSLKYEKIKNLFGVLKLITAT